MTEAGERLIEAAKEAVAIAKGEQPAARIHHNGFSYVPEIRWLPIESAPKDGTVFLGMSADDDWPQPMKWVAYDADEVEETGEAGFWTYCELLIADVTGSAAPIWWMPMVPLPSTPNVG